MNIDDVLRQAEERWVKKQADQGLEPNKLREADWVLDIENRVIAARYTGKSVVTNEEAMQLVHEIRQLRKMIRPTFKDEIPLQG